MCLIESYTYPPAAMCCFHSSRSAPALPPSQAFHDSRKFPQGVRSPQTTVQVAQVRGAGRCHSVWVACSALQDALPGSGAASGLPATHHLATSKQSFFFPTSQVKRLLPDPPSSRGVVYSKDPSVVLDDAILRPPSAPSSPPKVAPLGAAGSAAAGGSGGDAGGRADMEVDGDEAPVLPVVPMNQQRKDAIRAKSAGSGSAAGGSTPGAVVAGSLTAALQAASLQPLTAVKEAQGSGAAAAASGTRAAPAAGGQQRLDWLSSVFGKDAGKNASGGGAGAGQDLRAASPAATAGKAAAGGSGTTINLTATAVGAQWASGGVERVDMRPSSVTVRLC